MVFSLGDLQSAMICAAKDHNEKRSRSTPVPGSCSLYMYQKDFSCTLYLSSAGNHGQYNRGDSMTVIIVSGVSSTVVVE